MVDLRAAGLSRRGAADKVETALKGEPDSETLRKHYRELERAGQLPKPSAHIERKAEALRESYRRRTAAIEEARRELASAEERAQSLGLDLSGELENLSATIVFKLRDLVDFLDNEPRIHMYHYLKQGIEDEEEAAKRLIDAHKERELMERQLEALREVRHLRDIARQ